MDPTEGTGAQPEEDDRHSKCRESSDACKEERKPAQI
jgi:hypothetical protein